MQKATHVFLYLVCLQFFLFAMAAPPIDHGIMTKGDVAMAAVDGLGSLVNNFGQRLMDDLDDMEQILTELPTPAPTYNFQEQPLEAQPFQDQPFEEPEGGALYPQNGIAQLVDIVNIP